MQAAGVCFAGPLPIKRTKCLVPKTVSNLRRTFVCPKAVAASAAESSTIDYDSLTSVFPAEACDILGKEACRGVICPEVKLAASASKAIASLPLGGEESGCFEYNQPRTVFPGEACDDLGGEFCEAEYQMGVYREMALPK